MLSSLEALTEMSLHSSQGALQSSNTLPGTELQQTVFVCCWICCLLLVWSETKHKQKITPGSSAWSPSKELCWKADGKKEREQILRAGRQVKHINRSKQKTWQKTKKKLLQAGCCLLLFSTNSCLLLFSASFSNNKYKYAIIYLLPRGPEIQYLGFHMRHQCPRPGDSGWKNKDNS